MGRTLHYSITKESGDFERWEEEVFYNISKKYNSGPLEDAWSCENFWISTVDYFPNWDHFNREDGAQVIWSKINQRYVELEEKGLQHLDIVQKLVDEELVFLRRESGHEVRAFTKVQGNEFNSLLVYSALLEISELCPDVKIRLSDEGEFLYCDSVYIKQGKVLPDLDDIQESIKHWATLVLFSNKKTKLMREIKEEIYPLLDETALRDIDLENNYGDCADRYLKDYLKKYAAIMARLNDECGLGGHEMFLWNIKRRDPKKWFDPDIWHRPVDKKKFKDYKMTPGTLMDGFSGEGFGLTDEDSEAYSYRQIAAIQKLFKDAGYGKENIDILGAES